MKRKWKNFGYFYWVVNSITKFIFAPIFIVNYSNEKIFYKFQFYVEHATSKLLNFNV